MVQSNIDKSFGKKGDLLGNIRLVPGPATTNKKVNLFDSVKISGEDYEDNYYNYDDGKLEVSRPWFNNQDFTPAHKMADRSSDWSSSSRNSQPIVKPSFVTGPFSQIERPLQQNPNPFTGSSLDLSSLMRNDPAATKMPPLQIDSFFSQLNNGKSYNNMVDRSSMADLLSSRSSSGDDSNSFIDLLGGDPAEKDPAPVVVHNEPNSGFANLIHGKPLDPSTFSLNSASAGMRYTAGGSIRDPEDIRRQDGFNGFANTNIATERMDVYDYYDNVGWSGGDHSEGQQHQHYGGGGAGSPYGVDPQAINKEITQTEYVYQHRGCSGAYKIYKFLKNKFEGRIIITRSQS